MLRSLLCLCMVASMLGLPGQSAWAAGKHNKALTQVKGKIYLTNDVLNDTSLQALAAKFADKQPSLALERASDDTWSATLVAFLSRRPVRGPVYLWIYDKLKPGSPLFAKALGRRKVTKHVVYDLLLDGDLGFKKCGVYVMQVGQIIKNKNKAYTTGEVLTDPKSPGCKAKNKPVKPTQSKAQSKSKTKSKAAAR